MPESHVASEAKRLVEEVGKLKGAESADAVDRQADAIREQLNDLVLKASAEVFPKRRK